MKKEKSAYFVKSAWYEFWSYITATKQKGTKQIWTSNLHVHVHMIQTRVHRKIRIWHTNTSEQRKICMCKGPRLILYVHRKIGMWVQRKSIFCIYHVHVQRKMYIDKLISDDMWLKKGCRWFWLKKIKT